MLAGRNLLNIILKPMFSIHSSRFLHAMNGSLRILSFFSETKKNSDGKVWLAGIFTMPKFMPWKQISVKRIFENVIIFFPLYFLGHIIKKSQIISINTTIYHLQTCKISPCRFRYTMQRGETFFFGGVGENQALMIWTNSNILYFSTLLFIFGA